MTRIGESHSVRYALERPLDEFGCDYKTCENVSPLPRHRERACEVCGQPSLGAWCRVCEDWGRQVREFFDPLAGFDAGEPE